eukprot:g31952.t1
MPVVRGLMLQHQARVLEHLGGACNTSQMLFSLGGLKATRMGMTPAQALCELEKAKEEHADCRLRYAEAVARLPKHEMPNALLERKGRAKELFKREILRAGEYLFNPQLVLGDYDDSLISLQEAIWQVLLQCPVDDRADLWQNILLCGGGTEMKGMVERLTVELTELAAVRAKEVAGHDATKELGAPKVFAHSHRKVAAWEGGVLFVHHDPDHRQESWEFNDDWKDEDASEEAGTTERLPSDVQGDHDGFIQQLDDLLSTTC